MEKKCIFAVLGFIFSIGLVFGLSYYFRGEIAIGGEFLLPGVGLVLYINHIYNEYSGEADKKKMYSKNYIEK